MSVLEAGIRQVPQFNHIGTQIDCFAQVSFTTQELRRNNTVMVGESEPVAAGIQNCIRHERRHHDQSCAFPDARLQATIVQVVISVGTSADQIMNSGAQIPFDFGNLHTGIKPPAECVAAVRKADGCSIQINGLQIVLKSPDKLSQTLQCQRTICRSQSKNQASPARRTSA